MKIKFSANQFIIEPLEPRLLFSADLVASPLDDGLIYEDSMADLSVLETNLVANTLESSETEGAERRHELLFVDASVPDYQQLVDDLLAGHDNGRQVEVVVLDSSQDGIEQIGETLARYQDLDALHIISHGSDGAIQLGNNWLTPDTLDAYADSIEGWGDALTGQADILFYGCDLAAGNEGLALINSLTFLTGADIAASDDPTGSTHLGGDWALEYSTGAIESKVAVSPETQADWQGLLATTTIGDGTAPADKTIGKNQTNNAVSSFTLSTDSGTDTLTDVTVTFSGTNVSDIVANGVKIWQDNGTVANEWDPSDALISTASFSGTTANFTGLSVNVTTSTTQYLVTYDVDAVVTEGNILQGSVTSATVSNTLVNNDNTDATLTYDIDWYNPAWNYRKEITFDPSMTPNTDQYYFPVLVKLTSDADLAASAAASSQPNGDDILFTLADGVTKLDHEIETFVDSTGELWAWVEVPILSSSVDTTLYMYYGNSGAANQQNIAGTWNEGGNNNYKGVWHLDEEEAGTGTTPPHQDLYQDSSGNGNNGDDLVSDTLQTGQISSGQGFDGVDDYIDAGNDPSLDITSQITFSAWTKLTDAGAPLILRIISNKVVWDGPGGYEFTYEPTANTIHVSGSGSDTAQGTLVADTSLHYLVGVINGTTATIYVDGVDVTTNSTVSALASGTDNLYIGDQSGGAGANYKGFIDEARISSVARSADWIRTRFNNEGNPGAYTTVNTQESKTAVSGTVFTDEGTTNIGAGKKVRLLVNGINAGTALTDSDGNYTIHSSNILNAGDAILVYLDDDDGATNDASTVTVSDSSDLAGLDIYVGHLISRNDNGGALTNALMDTALGAYSDTEILYSVDGSDNLTVSGTNTELYIPTSHSFTPGGNVTTEDLQILGTLTAGTYNITVQGDWDSTGGTFNYDTGTVVMGTSGQSNTITTDPAAGWTGARFYNLTIADGATIDINSGTGGNRIKVLGQMTITGTLSIPSGLTLSLIYGNNNLTIDPTGVLTGAGTFERAVDDVPVHIVNNGTISVDTFQYSLRHWGAIPMTVTATTYGNNLIIKNWGSEDWDGVLGRTPGDTTSNLVVGGDLIIWHDRLNKTLSFDNTVENIDISIGGDLIVGNLGDNTRYASFEAGSATITVGGDVIIADSDVPGSTFIDAGSSTWNVTGNMDVRGTLTGGTSTITVSGDWDSVAGTFNRGTSEVVLTGASNDLTTNADWFHKLTIDAGATITAQDRSVIWSGGTLTISGTFNIAAGVLFSAINPNDIVINPGGELGGPGSFKQRVGSGAAVHSMNGTISVATYIYEVLNNAGSAPGHILTGTNYGGDLLITLSGNTAENWVYIGGGDLTVGGTLTVGSDRTWFGPFTAVLNNAQENRNVTVGNLVIGNSVDTDQYGRFIAGSGNIDVNGDVTILASDAGGTNEIDAGSSTWNVSGNWTNNDTFTPGTSTVTFDGINQAITGSTTFNNFTKVESSNDSTDSILTFDNTATQTINGTLTLDGLDADDRINLVSDNPTNQWSINLTASASKGTMDYLDVTDSDASGSDASHLTIDPANSIDGGNNIDWFDTTAPVVTVNMLTTNDTTPELTGTVDDPTATIQVTVNGSNYAATNNGDGTWTLADNTIAPALANGIYDVSVTATDTFNNSGSDATVNELTININVAPTATNLSATETYTKDTPLDLTDIVVSDVDSANVTVTLTLSDPAAGTLSTGTSGAVTSTYDVVTGAWTASGAIADVNILLTGLTFIPNSGYYGNFTISTSVDDGIAAPILGTKGITVISGSAMDPPIDDGGGNDDDDDDGDNNDEGDDEEEKDDEEVVPEEEEAPDGNYYSQGRPRTKGPKSSLKSVRVDFKPVIETLSTGDLSVSEQASSDTTENFSVLKNEGREDFHDIKQDFYSSIRKSRNSIESIDRQENFITKTILGTTLSLSVGLATWIFRTGSLVASAITSMPLWKGFDPLPVLPLSRKERRKKMKEVRIIEDDESRKNKEIAELLDKNKSQRMKGSKREDRS